VEKRALPLVTLRFSFRLRRMPTPGPTRSRGRQPVAHPARDCLRRPGPPGPVEPGAGRERANPARPFVAQASRGAVRRARRAPSSRLRRSRGGVLARFGHGSGKSALSSRTKFFGATDAAGSGPRCPRRPRVPGGNGSFTQIKIIIPNGPEVTVASSATDPGGRPGPGRDSAGFGS
jgi:hypothetical protein